jgi:hypothetical protein
VPDKDDITSEVLVFALALAAKIERAGINDRISAARERVEAEGGRWGRPLRVGRADVARALTLRREGRSVPISVALKCPGPPFRALSDVSGGRREPTPAASGTRAEAGQNAVMSIT